VTVQVHYKHSNFPSRNDTKTKVRKNPQEELRLTQIGGQNNLKNYVCVVESCYNCVRNNN